jgi:hypothetical protein
LEIPASNSPTPAAIMTKIEPVSRVVLEMRDHTNSTISLRSSSDHVLDEITVARSIDDSDIVLGSLKLPESNVNGDTTFTLGL